MKEVSEIHGVPFLEKKQASLIVNKSNKNDVLNIIGHPHSKSINNEDVWIYLERTLNKGKFHKLGQHVLTKNNTLVLYFDKFGVLKQKEFYHYYSWGRLPVELSTNTKKLYEELVNLTSILLQWIEDETPDHIKSLFSIPLPNMIENSRTHLLRIIHYPPLDGTEKSGAIRGAAHEDINLITLLIGAEEGGLEVLNKNDEWIRVQPSSNSIVCNIGDMMQLVTNKKLKSTTHRVVQYVENEPTSRAILLPDLCSSLSLRS